jgi:acetylornithine aminotransferase
MATLTASGSRKVHAGFEPLVAGFARVPYDDVAAVRQVATNNQSVVAMLVEPITGEGGINIPAESYLHDLRVLCDQHGWLLMLDEVQTGIARTGKWFAHQHTGIMPDVMTLAKGLGGGVPIGACLARGDAAALFQPGKHGSTFGGNPLACAAALTVLDIIEAEGLVENAHKTGEYLLARLRQEFAGVSEVTQIRGRGLMLGIELDRACTDLVGLALARGLIINVTADNVVRLVPPLIFNLEHADLLISTLVPLIREFLARSSEQSAG